MNPSSYVVRNSQYYYLADAENPKDEKNSSNTTMLCDQCPFITTSIEDLHDHVYKVHMHKYKYTCDHCFFSSKLLDRLTSHIIKEHPLMPSQFCLRCPLTFMTGMYILQND